MKIDLSDNQPTGLSQSFTDEAGSQPAGRRFPFRKLFWQGKIGPAFWTTASLLSLAVNAILIVVLLVTGRYLFDVKRLVTQQLIAGLYYNFILMDQARITTTIEVEDTIRVEDNIQVVFDLPLEQETRVVLSEDAPIQGATIYLNGQPVPIDLVLKSGTALDIRLDLTVPVSQTVPVVLDVPVRLEVPVDIPLNQTELHEPFVGLQQVVAPYYRQLSSPPNSWSETGLCSSDADWLCASVLGRR